MINGSEVGGAVVQSHLQQLMQKSSATIQMQSDSDTATVATCNRLRQQQLSIESGTWQHPRRMRNVHAAKIYRKWL